MEHFAYGLSSEEVEKCRKQTVAMEQMAGEKETKKAAAEAAELSDSAEREFIRQLCLKRSLFSAG